MLLVIITYYCYHYYYVCINYTDVVCINYKQVNKQINNRKNVLLFNIDGI